MIVEGGRLKCSWGLQLGEVVFTWLVATFRDILRPRDYSQSFFLQAFLISIMFCTVVTKAQNCDVDFPGCIRSGLQQ